MSGLCVAGLGAVCPVAGGGDAEIGIGVGIGIGVAIAADWSLGTGLALLAWCVFAPQCPSTLAAIRRETSAKWIWVAVGCMFALAWLAAFATFRVATLPGS